MGVRSPKLLLVLWLVLTSLGATLIALPDQDQGLIRFSSEHGPGLVDLVGALILLVGAALLNLDLLKRRAVIASSVRAEPARLGWLSFSGGLGLGLLIAGVFTDFWWWWLIGAVLIQALQFAVWAMALREAKAEPPQGSTRPGSPHSS